MFGIISHAKTCETSGSKEYEHIHVGEKEPTNYEDAHEQVMRDYKARHVRNGRFGCVYFGLVVNFSLLSIF